MTYYKCIDDWNDEHKLSQKIMAETIRKNMRMLLVKYPQNVNACKKEFKRLHFMKKTILKDIDTVSSCFGTILATIFAIKNDEWKRSIRKKSVSF